MRKHFSIAAFAALIAFGGLSIGVEKHTHHKAEAMAAKITHELAQGDFQAKSYLPSLVSEARADDAEAPAIGGDLSGAT